MSERVSATSSSGTDACEEDDDDDDEEDDEVLHTYIHTCTLYTVHTPIHDFSYCFRMTTKTTAAMRMTTMKKY